jgi:immune inhibitor A
MKKSMMFFVLTALISLFSTANLFAVPLADNVIQQLKDEGKFDDYIRMMAAARAKGVDSPKSMLQMPNKGGVTTFRVLVILIDFQDKYYTGGYTAGTVADFDSLLFSDGLNPTGSMKEFYYKNSYGNFILQGDVVGWYRAANDAAYYTNFCDGSDGLGAYPHNAQKLVEEAVDAADPDVDFSQYDNNGDGYVDGIFVVHAGTGYEETGNNCEIHSHQWSISSRYKDGVYVRAYSIEPEESPSSQGLIPIGVFCHEFGHVLGLPDLYDTDYSSSGAGHWALMASGSYNGLSRSPSDFIAWSKMKLGWLNPVNLTANQTNVQVPAIEYNPVAYRLWTNGQIGNQYFIVENRQQVESDAYLPGSGILIWHIDDNVHGNTNDWHPQVMLEQADGKFDLQYGSNQGDANDAYPSGGLYPQFTDKTNPNSKDYNLNSTQVALWNISPSDSIMTTDMDVTWSRPYLYLTNYSFDDAAGGNGNGILEPGETIDLVITVANDWKTANSAEVDLSVDDATLNILTATASLGTISTGGSATNSGSPLQFEIPLDYTPRIDSFYLNIVSDGGQYGTLLAVEQNVGKPAVLIVDDDNNDSLETYYTSPLYTRRTPYDVWSVYTSGAPSSDKLASYDGVIWFTGDYRDNPLSTAEIDSMQAYFDGGGKLFLSGQGIAYELSTVNPTFLQNYLKAAYLSTSLVPVVVPESTSQVFSGLGNIAIYGSGGASNQFQPDHIAAASGGNPELNYLGYSDLAAVSYTGSYKLMFFSFGMEGIRAGDPRFVERDTVFNRVLNFLGAGAMSDYPEVASVSVGPGDPTHLIDHTPIISWPYYDPGGNPQQEYQVQVGTDNDWSAAEKWDYGPISSADTSVTYAGSTLDDGATYYVRVRAFNGIQWSSWRQVQIRFNSVPTDPTGLDPDNLAGVTSANPPLVHLNSTDAEGDQLTYAYQVYSDSLLTQLVVETDGQPEGVGSSQWAVTTALDEDSIYYWRTRAFDGFEFGPWSASASFWVNADNQLPTAFQLAAPPDSTLILDMLPVFVWTSSVDNDRFDTARYTFLLADNDNFAAADTVTGLSDTSFTAVDSLLYGNTYFWKVLAYDKFGGVTPSDQVFRFSTLLPGDANHDGDINIGDPVYLINYIFRGGPPPDPLELGDVNGDCAINIGDAVYLINFIFKGGPPPDIGCQ